VLFGVTFRFVNIYLKYVTCVVVVVVVVVVIVLGEIPNDA